MKSVGDLNGATVRRTGNGTKVFEMNQHSSQARMIKTSKW